MLTAPAAENSSQGNCESLPYGYMRRCTQWYGGGNLIPLETSGGPGSGDQFWGAELAEVGFAVWYAGLVGLRPNSPPPLDSSDALEFAGGLLLCERAGQKYLIGLGCAHVNIPVCFLSDTVLCDFEASGYPWLEAFFNPDFYGSSQSQDADDGMG